MIDLTIIINAIIVVIIILCIIDTVSIRVKIF